QGQLRDINRIVLDDREKAPEATVGGMNHRGAFQVRDPPGGPVEGVGRAEPYVETALQRLHDITLQRLCMPSRGGERRKRVVDVCRYRLAIIGCEFGQ